MKKIDSFEKAQLEYSCEEWLHYLEQRTYDIVEYAKKDFKSLEEISMELFNHPDADFHKVQDTLFTKTDVAEIERIFEKYIIYERKK
jgi:hypothetical protein